jgi:hypothetical protein
MLVAQLSNELEGCQVELATPFGFKSVIQIGLIGGLEVEVGDACPVGEIGLDGCIDFGRKIRPLR